MHTNNQKKEVFIQKIDDTHYNCIELIKEGDSLKGEFYGVEVMSPSQESLYYKSILSDLKVDGDRIDFNLNTFSFSKKSLYGKQEDSLFLNRKPDVIPYLFNFSIKYFGYRNHDTLRMKKVTILDDSNFTEALFVKKND